MNNKYKYGYDIAYKYNYENKYVRDSYMKKINAEKFVHITFNQFLLWTGDAMITEPK